MVGTTARADCRGPNVLNGRRMTTGTSYVHQNASHSLSAAIFVALYGDCARKGCDSRIGMVLGVPYTSLVEVWISLAQWARRTASRTLRVPRTFVSTKDSGAW